MHASTKSRLQTTAAVVVASLVYLKTRHTLPAVVAGTFLVFAAIAWLSPRHYVPVQKGFDQLAHWTVLGVSWVLLAAVFILIFTPMHLIRRLRGADPLELKLNPAEPTYLRPLPPAEANRFERQF
ncbi:MAG: hypothetical protein JSS11_12010 [Verrucomicrobia bacterium]|nr:hypothetical protein [Verrucomicrobiota bacterium]